MEVQSDFYSQGDYEQPRGRLVLVLEHQLSEASRDSLRDLLRTFRWTDDVTMVSGLSRASMFQADEEGPGVFYNHREYIEPEEASRLLPWREVWLVAGGRVWQLGARCH